MNLSLARKAIKRQRLLRSHKEFTTYFFEAKEGQEFILGAHHEVMCKTLDKVFTGDIKRLIINVPPGYSKTELAVINFVARGFAKNKGARFIHASYSDSLALDNSSKVKELTQLEEYRDFWEVDLKADATAKGLWRTAEGGGFRASAAGSSITGFRAGRLTPEGQEWSFNGALIVDDPLKPDDARSDTKRTAINDRWENTFRSRLAEEDTPVIVIMQRLHIEDFVGHLLDNSGEKWHLLKLPIRIEGEEEPHENAIQIEHGLPDGPLWPRKHNEEQIKTLEGADEVFHGQYMQEPIVSGGNLFKLETVNDYDEVPKLAWRAIYADTAQKTAERNDFSVFQEWGVTESGNAYLLDQARGKYEAPELEKVAGEFWNKAKKRDIDAFGVLRKLAVEDKSSGTGLIQGLKRKIPVEAIQRERDKYTRALDVVPSFASGLVYLPRNAKWRKSWESEFTSFPDGKHDDQMDPMMDAVCEMCGQPVYSLDNL